MHTSALASCLSCLLGCAGVREAPADYAAAVDRDVTDACMICARISMHVLACVHVHAHVACVRVCLGRALPGPSAVKALCAHACARTRARVCDQQLQLVRAYNYAFMHAWAAGRYMPVKLESRMHLSRILGFFHLPAMGGDTDAFAALERACLARGAIITRLGDILHLTHYSRLLLFGSAVLSK